MNNFDAFRPVTRRHFWDDYRSPLTCVEVPTNSASASGSTIDIDILPVTQAAGPVSLSGIRAGTNVTLTWSAVVGAYSFVVYRGPTVSGPFTIQVAGIIGQTFLDSGVPPGTFFRVTAVEPRFGETSPSPTIIV